MSPPYSSAVKQLGDGVFQLGVLDSRFKINILNHGLLYRIPHQQLTKQLNRYGYS